jgi:hypothetical protein
LRRTGAGAISDVWDVMSTARTIRRFTDDPVDDATLVRCLEAATWAPSGANAQGWRFVVLRSPEQRAAVATAAARALEVIEPVYGMTRPAADDHSHQARNNRATYELHDRAGEFTSVLFTQQRYPTASELLLGGAVGVPDDWLLGGHIVVGWPRGRHGPVRRRPLDKVVNLDHWDEPATGLLDR